MINSKNRQIRKVLLGTQPIQKIYKGMALVFSSGRAPTIQSFSVAPQSIDLDLRSTGNLQFLFNVLGTENEFTRAKLLNLSRGLGFGPTYVSSRGNGINQRWNIAQPYETTRYRLIAENNTGVANADVMVSITQNPHIQNLTRSGFIQAPGLNQGTFIFTAIVKGYPQPNLRYRFGSGAQGDITPRHLSPRSGENNSWNLSWRVYVANLSDSLVVTAVNSSGSNSASIHNISA